jgi:PAS domain S-box-containing protein
MLCSLGFSQASDHRFLVTTEVISGRHRQVGGRFVTTVYSDENTFLYYVVLANLSEDDTTSVIANVLLALSDQPKRAEWVVLELSEHQFVGLGLDPPSENYKTGPAGMGGFLSSADFGKGIMQSPAPITMMSGPEHVFTFINPAYVRMIGRETSDSFLGKTVREAFPELEGQPFYGLLDDVYRTGKSYVGKEVLANLYKKKQGALEGVYFDFVYYPVRDDNDAVCGILCQANDVTQRVVDREVSESRESRLYNQWAELEAIYRMSPLGMALVDVDDYKILRINETNANMIGMTAEEITGKHVFNIFPEWSALLNIYTRVAAGEVVRNVHFAEPLAEGSREARRWVLNFSPVLDSFGKVEAIASIALEISESKEAEHIRLELPMY